MARTSRGSCPARLSRVHPHAESSHPGAGAADCRLGTPLDDSLRVAARAIPGRSGRSRAGRRRGIRASCIPEASGHGSWSKENTASACAWSRDAPSRRVTKADSPAARSIGSWGPPFRTPARWYDSWASVWTDPGDSPAVAGTGAGNLGSRSAPANSRGASGRSPLADMKPRPALVADE